MPTLIELRERVNALSTTMGTLGQKSERTDDEERQLDAALAEFNDISPKYVREQSIYDAAQRGRDMNQSAGRISGMVPNEGRAEENTPPVIDRRSIGKRFVDELGAQGFATSDRRSDPVKVGGLLRRNGFGPGSTYGGDGPAEQRTLVYSGVQPGYLVPDMVVPTIYRPNDYALTMRDVLLSGRTTSDTVYFVRELAFTNAAAETAEATAATGATGTKPESALTFEQASSPVATIAHWIPVTRQMLQDAAQIQDYINGRLLVGLERRLDTQVLSGNGTAPNIRGILNTSGIQALTSAGEFTTTPVTGTATGITANLNRIRRGVRLIDTTGDAVATFIVLNPADAEKFDTGVDTTGNYMGSGPFDRGSTARIWGLPVVLNRSMTAGTALLGDGTMAQIWDREDGNILVDTINDQFIRNMLTILAELRAALTVYRPAAFATVQLTTF